MTTQRGAAAGPEAYVAAEIRAELARQKMSIRQFARSLSANQQWVNRRVSTLESPMSLADVQLMADGLGVPVWRLLPHAWRPGRTGGLQGARFKAPGDAVAGVAA